MRPIIVLVASLLLTSPALGQQSVEIPSEVKRRLAQAIWPDHLFDEAGQPEDSTPAKPVSWPFESFTVVRSNDLLRLPGVTIYAGMASRSCAHCPATIHRAVIERDSTRVTLMEPSDLAYLLSWASPFEPADTVALRDFVFEVLRATCLMGCDIKRLYPDTEEARSLEDNFFVRAPGIEGGEWTMPRVYSHANSLGIYGEFPVHVPERLGAGTVYRIHVRYSDGRDSYLYPELVATYLH